MLLANRSGGFVVEDCHKTKNKMFDITSLAPEEKFQLGYKDLKITICGRNSVVECQLPKLNVVSSNLIARFNAVGCNVSQVVAQRCNSTRVTHIIVAVLVDLALGVHRILWQQTV